MSTMSFQKATKKQAKLRLALEGPAGFGKTYTALMIATNLADNAKIAFIDTEAGSASKYAHLFQFDVIEMGPPFDPRRAVEAIGMAVAGGYDVAIIDSLSHFWQGKGGLLEIVGEIGRTKYHGDSHRAWKEGGEIEQELIDAILRSPIHVIGAMRTKRDYVRTTDENGKTKIRAAGTKTIQREEFDFEFDVVGRFDVPSVLTVMKTRVDTLPPETVVDKPGAEFAAILRTWLETGETVELATAEQKDRLAWLCVELDRVDHKSRAWAVLAEEVAKRDHNRTVAQLTTQQFATVVQQFEDHLASVTEPAALGSADAEGSAANGDGTADQAATFPPNAGPKATTRKKATA